MHFSAATRTCSIGDGQMVPAWHSRVTRETDGVENFTRNLIEDCGVLLLPGSIYDSQLAPTPKDHFRLGFGRKGLDEGLAVLESYIMKNRV